MRRICIAWGGMPAYAACAVRQFMTDYIGEVALIATASDVPKTCADEICGVKINWVLDEDGRSIEDVIGFVPDVLFVSGWFIPSFNRFVNEVNAYGGRVIVGTDNRDRSGWSGVIWSLYFRFKIKRKFSAFMTPGESGRRLLRKGGCSEEEMRTNLYTADPAVFHPGTNLSCREKIVVYVGRYDTRKNILPFAKAFSSFASKNTEWRLECYGQGALESALRRLPYVQVNGFLQPKELASRYRFARAFVLPSREDHWGVVVHEAALSGCALLLSDQVGAADDLANGCNSMLFAPGDELAMFRALEKMSQKDDSSWDEAGKMSVTLAGRITPANFSRNLMELINRE